MAQQQNCKFLKKFSKKVCRLNFLLYLCTRNTATGCSAVRLAHLVWDQRVPGSNPGTPTKKTTFELSSFFCRVTRLRSACCASADLSASCCECAELLRNNDNRLNSGISNKFACRYSIYYLNLRFSAHSFTSWSALGCCRRSNSVVGAQVN